MPVLEGLECCQRALGLDTGGSVSVKLESCRFSQLFSLVGSCAAAAPAQLMLDINSCQFKEVQVGWTFYTKYLFRVVIFRPPILRLKC
jgi:hypothetical protein